MTAVLEEVRAAEAEGAVAPTAEQSALLARRRVLYRQEQRAKAKRQAIEDQIEREMREQGVRALVEDGQNVVLISPVTTGVSYVNENAMGRLYPAVVAAHRTYVELAPIFTTETRVPKGDRVTFR